MFNPHSWLRFALWYYCWLTDSISIRRSRSPEQTRNYATVTGVIIAIGSTYQRNYSRIYSVLSSSHVSLSFANLDTLRSSSLHSNLVSESLTFLPKYKAEWLSNRNSQTNFQTTLGCSSPAQAMDSFLRGRLRPHQYFPQFPLEPSLWLTKVDK